MALAAEFEEFWSYYPRRVGKLAAQRAYEKARKRATHEEIMAGVDAYVQHKPEYADYCHAATWLNQGRWMDDWSGPSGKSAAAERPMSPREVDAFQAWLRAMNGCGHAPRCASRAECGQKFSRRYRGAA